MVNFLLSYVTLQFCVNNWIIFRRFTPRSKKEEFRMKILIAADMEGISGVVNWEQVSPGHSEYERFRRIMTADVNAAILGAVESGAEQILVADGHAYARNILIEELDPRARLNSGSPSPFSMVQGIDEGVDGVIFIGYHARVGTQNAILEHTWSSKCVAGLLVNDRPFGEIGLNAALCGHFGVPVIAISGDQSACAEASELIAGIETAVVKQAHGRMAAECLPPIRAYGEIEEAARVAVERLAHGQAPQPLRLGAPINAAVELASSEMADQAAWLPGAERQGRVVSYTAKDMPTIYRAFRSIVGLAR
jgi:D-amino peptidase